MFDKKRNAYDSLLNEELKHTIDNMKDDKDYNPYEAVKKTEFKTDDMFSEELYEESKEDKEDSMSFGSIMLALVVIVILLALGGGVAYYILHSGGVI